MQYKQQKQYRYKEYDYSQNGFYFITICTQNKQLFFGDIINAKMQLSEIGEIAQKYWLEIPNHFKNIKVNEHIIMPNHIHGIIQIDQKNNTHRNRRNRALPCSNQPYNKNYAVPQCSNQPYNKNHAVQQCSNQPYNKNHTVRYSNQPPNKNHAAQQCSNINKTPPSSQFSHVTAKSISIIIGSFKSITTKTINIQFPNNNFAWQPRFHNRIIRNEEALNKIKFYIRINVEKWNIDRNNPKNSKIQ